MSLIESKKQHAPEATETTLFLRSNFLFQFIRFLIINAKMTVMIIKSHGKQLPPTKK